MTTPPLMPLSSTAAELPIHYLGLTVRLNRALRRLGIHRYRGQVTWSDDPAGYQAHNRDRRYADAYHCRHCLHLELRNERVIGHMGHDAQFGAVEYDRRPV